MECNSDSDADEHRNQCTPPELRNAAEIAKNDIIPRKSKNRYQNAYNNFIVWQEKNGASDIFSESVLLAYFNELSITKSPATLWSTHSMLKSMLKLKHHVSIVKFTNLFGFLKAKGKGYTPKKAPVFSDEQISEFMDNAPDEIYLAKKVSTKLSC